MEEIVVSLSKHSFERHLRIELHMVYCTSRYKTLETLKNTEGQIRLQTKKLAQGEKKACPVLVQD